MIDLESRRPVDRRDEYVRRVTESAADGLRENGFTVTTSRRGPSDHGLQATDPTSGGGLVTRVFGYEHGDSFVVVSIGAATGAGHDGVIDGARGHE